MNDAHTSPFVYISYAPADGVFSARLKADLQDQGITIWSERKDIEAGTADSEEAVRGAIRASYAVLLIASPNARMSRYVRDELKVAGIYSRPVYPIWAEGTQWIDAVPFGWGSAQYIDARDDKYKEALRDIKVRLDKPFPKSFQMQKIVSEPRNPYKGLQAFKTLDARDFFGREQFVGELTTALNETLATSQQATQPVRLLAIVGPSGSGKSSVLLAGLLPALHAGRLPNSANWTYLDPFVPGLHPLEDLAHALAQQFPETQSEVILAELKESAQSLHRYTTMHTSTPEMYVVLAIDQFEELFAPTVSEEERNRFVELVALAAKEPVGHFIVLLTLRADFYDRPLKYPALASLIQHHHHLLLPLTLSDLRAVITRPAALPDVQVAFEGDLVGDILFDLQGQPGALPLLQFTLDRMFRHRQGQLLTLETYRAIGGARKALALHAEETYNHLPSDEHRQLARVLFLRLMNATETEQPMLRRAASTEFLLTNEGQTRVLQETLEAFVTARLITTEQGTETTFVEVSHEALVQEWKQLTTWLREAPEENHLQQELSRNVADWEQHKHARDRLYRGAQLKAMQAWAKRNVASQAEHAFLAASQRRQTRIRVSVFAIVFLILLLSVPTTLFAFQALRANVTTLKDSGPGSLRQAILAAKPGDTITFDSSLKGTLFLTSTLTINKNLIIRGPGADVFAISSGSKDYDIRLLPKFLVSISGISFKNSTHTNHGFLFNEANLTLIECKISGNTVTGRNGGSAGITNEGGILKLIGSSIIDNKVTNMSIIGAGGVLNDLNSTMVLINSAISSNAVTGQNTAGGGIVNRGSLTFTNSQVSNNVVSGQVRATGGGIWNIGGTLTLNHSIVSDNKVVCSGDIVCGIGGFGGGGIYNSKHGMLTVNNSIISGNQLRGSYSLGGGILNTDNSTATLINSTVSGNSTGYDGGGLLNFDAKLILTNSTISENTATRYGGGITAEGGQTTITFCTVYANTTATAGGGIAINDNAHTPVDLRNSIVVENRASSFAPDVLGTLTTYGYNLLSDSSGTGVIDSLKLHVTDNVDGNAGDLNIDPVLRNNREFTPTHALLPGSVAINQIPLGACLIDNISTDQRGVKRPQGAACDIGAYEYATGL